jgi:hypothetical protein
METFSRLSSRSGDYSILRGLYGLLGIASHTQQSIRSTGGMLIFSGHAFAIEAACGPF